MSVRLSTLAIVTAAVVIAPLARRVPYEVRLESVQEVAHAHPVAAVSADPLGEWAGIYYFTEWQLDSGRDAIPLWEILNREFTIRPHAIAAALASDPGYDCAGHADPHVCRGWLDVFRDTGPGDRAVLWRAHVRALVEALEGHRRRLAEAEVRRPERRFWRGRTCLIFVLQRMDFPMTAEAVRPIVERLEPPCAPLGSPGCRIRDLEDGARRAYVYELTEWGRRPRSLDRCALTAAPPGDVAPLLRLVDGAVGR